MEVPQLAISNEELRVSKKTHIFYVDFYCCHACIMIGPTLKFH